VIARAHHSLILVLAVLLAAFWPTVAGANYTVARADRTALRPALQLEEKGFTRKIAFWPDTRLTLENRAFGAEPAIVFFDGSGNITALINENQNIVARYEFDGFGRLLGMWGALARVNVMRFSSMPVHSQSGLILYPLRAGYDPTLQRWTQRDPIGEMGGINLYTYVGNDPANGIDPWGLYNPITGPSGAVGPGSGLPNPSIYLQPPSPTPTSSGQIGGHEAYELQSLVAGDLSLSQSIVQFGSGVSTVSENGQIYVNYAKGFYGNKYVAAVKITKCAERIAPPLAVASIYIDYRAWRNDGLSGTKFGFNTGFTGLGFVAPPYGAIAAGSYFLIDTTYPGGAESAWDDYQTFMDNAFTY